MNDNVVLSYHDSLLYESDLALLSESTAWLNDRLIAFVYEYLERERYNHESTSHLMAFVNPSTVQYLKLAVGDLNDAIACFIDPLELNNKKYIFLPLNNNSSLESSGGCHWSLLLVDSSSKRLLHFDSIGSNKHIADSFFKRAKIYFNVDRIEHVNFPKQTNSSDCGVYVLGIGFTTV